MITIIQRILLLLTVMALSLLTLWLFLLALVGLTGLLAPLESHLWLAYSLFALTSAIGAWLLSRGTARWSLGVRSLRADELWLKQMAEELAHKAGLLKTPEIGIYESFEVNAFAAGVSCARSLIGVSTGMIESFPRPAIEAALAHEIAHIKNGDMVTMTLLKSWINALVLLPARLIAWLTSRTADPRQRGAVYLLTYTALQLLICPAASLLVCHISRQREFRADREAAKLISTEQMRAGLTSLREVYGLVDDTHQAFQALKISGHSAEAFASLFFTHPTIEQRIRRLT